jgi:GT2 family glycosyltransferase
MRLSIVIPTLGHSPTLPAVLARLAEQTAGHPVEVVLVFDAQAPGRASLTPPPELEVRILRAARAGASAARNVGWRAARAPLVLFLDDDIVPTPRLVAEHLAWHDRYPVGEVAVLGPVRWSPAVRVTPFMRWLEAGIQFDYGSITGLEAGWERFYSCNVSLKGALLEQVGGFDEEDFPFGYEDLDLARRLADHGLRLLYNRAALGHHLKTETPQSWRRNLRRIAIAERRFVERYPEARPYFYERFASAQAAPAPNGRAARLTRFVPPGTPWVGPLAWRSYDAVLRAAFAPEFLAEWAAAAPAPHPGQMRSVPTR